MSTDIQHLWREYSDGTVIGGERFIKLGHFASDTWQTFYQMYLEAHLGKIQ
jgi:hypothetical protein